MRKIWLKRLTVVTVRLLMAIAIAFTVARWTTWIWTDWYLHVQGIPPLERAPDPYLTSTASAIFYGLFLVVLLMAVWRMRRRALSWKKNQVQAHSATHSTDRLRWHHRLAAYIGHALVAFCLAYASAELTARIYFRWYAFDTAMTAQDRSDDLGVGIRLFLICAPVFVIVMILAWTWLYLAWRTSVRREGVEST
jgi:hypothetical protein